MGEKKPSEAESMGVIGVGLGEDRVALSNVAGKTKYGTGEDRFVPELDDVDLTDDMSIAAPFKSIYNSKEVHGDVF